MQSIEKSNNISSNWLQGFHAWILSTNQLVATTFSQYLLKACCGMSVRPRYRDKGRKATLALMKLTVAPPGENPSTFPAVRRRSLQRLGPSFDRHKRLCIPNLFLFLTRELLKHEFMPFPRSISIFTLSN